MDGARRTLVGGIAAAWLAPRWLWRAAALAGAPAGSLAEPPGRTERIHRVGFMSREMPYPACGKKIAGAGRIDELLDRCRWRGLDCTVVNDRAACSGAGDEG